MDYTDDYDAWHDLQNPYEWSEADNWEMEDEKNEAGFYNIPDRWYGWHDLEKSYDYDNSPIGYAELGETDIPE